MFQLNSQDSSVSFAGDNSPYHVQTTMFIDYDGKSDNKNEDIDQFLGVPSEKSSHNYGKRRVLREDKLTKLERRLNYRIDLKINDP